jgi:hypothetical protein
MNETAPGASGRAASLRNLILLGATSTGLLLGLFAVGRWRGAPPAAADYPRDTVSRDDQDDQDDRTVARPTAGAPLPARPPKLIAAQTADRTRTSNEAFHAQGRGPGSRKPSDFHKEESRDPVWAGAMEKRLDERFAATKLQELGIAGLKIDSTDCRTSSCRLEVSWTMEDLQALEKPGGEHLDPLSLLTWSTGPLAATEYRTKLVPGDLRVPGAWNVRRRPDGRFSTTTVVLFGDDDIDPNRYHERTAQRRQARVDNPILPR